MKSARLGSSPRLRRTLDLLERSRTDDGGGWLTTRQIVRRASICAVNSVIAELRENGCTIACHVMTDAAGRRRWRYRLESAPKGWRDRPVTTAAQGKTT